MTVAEMYDEMAHLIMQGKGDMKIKYWQEVLMEFVYIEKVEVRGDYEPFLAIE